MSDRQHFIVATAGHVDHGKSALVQALTGTDPDRLPEEKARGITIDLGFAHLEIPSPDPSASFLLGIVDVPGHEDFVKNMVAGVGSIDLALLIVAADDGWMPQTEEHLQILTYFGVRHAVVALTKADLTTDPAAAAVAVRERLRDTPFGAAPIVPTSVVTGSGLDDLRSTLSRVLATLPPPRDIGKPRLPVDRVFTLPGIGTIVTGTLFGGTLKRGQSVVVQPSGRTTRLRRIQSHAQDVDTSGPATRTALNLTDLDASDDVHRGEVVTIAGLGNPTSVLDVLLDISPRAARPVKDGLRVRVHLGSGNVAAHVALSAGKELAVGARALAQLRLEAPAFAFVADRFTVRDWSEQHTLAGGVVLDPDAARKGFRTRARTEWLDDLAAAIDDVSGVVRLYLARAGAVSRSQLLSKSNFSAGDVAQATARLVEDGVLVDAGDSVCDGAHWQSLTRRAEDAIDAAHRAHPEHLGVPLADLRAVLEAELPVADVLDALIAGLCERGFVRAGSVVRRASHRPALPGPLKEAGAKLGAALAAKPLEPPSRKELTPDALSQRALRFMIDTGEVVEISAELVLTAHDVARASDVVRRFLREHGPATVSDLRQALGSSRRVVVPLLEYLDRTFVTVRQGDKRALRA
uniref:Selenocysteine-specific elongation factor n=1 Tax=uncultured bacterium BAC10-10 TaxID=333372 RepID=Q4JIN1_9BACT|nr:selenocysteine-specific translation elongation factor [uncultured bacterium BAC10-10]